MGLGGASSQEGVSGGRWCSGAVWSGMVWYGVVQCGVVWWWLCRAAGSVSSPCSLAATTAPGLTS